MLQIGDNEGVLCSANQTCYHEKNLQSSFFVVIWVWGVGVGIREWMLGSVKVVDMQVSRMDSTLYIVIRQTISLKA